MTKRYPTVETLSEMKCDTRELETSLSHLGDVVELPENVPRYSTFHTPIVATESGGSSPKLIRPLGVAIHEESHQIFVANDFNKRIDIFSETGEFLYHLGLGHVVSPYGVAIHGDSVYVSCKHDHTVSKFSLTEMCLVRRIGGMGSDNGQFKLPIQLTTDPIGRVFIADNINNRICIHDPNLNHLYNIGLPRPFDVKISDDLLYVLCPFFKSCMYILTLEGKILHRLTPCGYEMENPNFFCLDPLNNFVISDFKSHSIRVFSPEGNLLHTIGRRGFEKGMFYKPTGVAVTPNRRLVCLSMNASHGLQIFC